MQKTASIPENRSSKLFRALGGILSNKEQCASKFKGVRIGDSSMPNGGSFRAQPKKNKWDFQALMGIRTKTPCQSSAQQMIPTVKC